MNAAIIYLATILPSSPAPVDGPSISIACLPKLTLQQKYVSQCWTNGVYTVSFTYKSHLPKQKVIEMIVKSIPNAPKPLKGDASGYGCTRSVGGVIQQINVWYMGDWTDANYDRAHGTKHVRLTSISVSEIPDPWSARPAKWYRGAISARPPAPKFNLPFQAKVVNQTIAIDSLSQLCSTRGTYQPGSDAVSYTCYCDESYSVVSKRAEAHFRGNGYARTRYGAYYKQTPGAFNYLVYPVSSRKTQRCAIQVTTAKKMPPGPVYLGPRA